MNGSFFVFIRHAESALDLEKPARLWPLTALGRKQAAALGQKLTHLGLTRLVVSEEQKAQQTAEGMTAVLGIGWETAVNLHEHDRRNVTNMSGSEFKANVAQLLRYPKTHQFGTERGEAARLRFETAVKQALIAHPEERLGIVAHGTVITLFLAAHNQLEPVIFWQALPMPAALVVDAATFRLIEQIRL